MRLGGEIDDVRAAFDRRGYGGRIGDVSLEEPVVAAAVDVREVGGVGGVGQLVEVYDRDGVAARTKEVPDEIRSDETAPPGDQHLHRGPPRALPRKTENGKRKTTTTRIPFRFPIPVSRFPPGFIRVRSPSCRRSRTGGP